MTARLPRMPGVVGSTTVRARVVHTAFRHLADGVPYLEVRFQRLDFQKVDPQTRYVLPTAPTRARYWLTPGALSATQRGLAAVGLTLNLDDNNAWVVRHEYGPSHTFDLPLVQVECSVEETHGAAGVVREFVQHPARPEKETTS